MTDPMVLARKLALLTEHLARAKRRRRDNYAEFASDLDCQDALALSVMVVVQEAVDIAFHISTDEGWGLPSTYAESFDLLARHQVIDQELALALGASARLRSRIAHGYATMDTQRLWTELPDGLLTFERFAQSIAAWLIRK